MFMSTENLEIIILRVDGFLRFTIHIISLIACSAMHFGLVLFWFWFRFFLLGAGNQLRTAAFAAVCGR